MRYFLTRLGQASLVVLLCLGWFWILATSHGDPPVGWLALWLLLVIAVVGILGYVTALGAPAVGAWMGVGIVAYAIALLWGLILVGSAREGSVGEDIWVLVAFISVQIAAGAMGTSMGVLVQRDRRAAEGRRGPHE